MRRLALTAGLVLAAAIWAGLLVSPWSESFTVRMLAHMGMVAVAAPLISIGIGGTRWARRVVGDTRRTSFLLSMPIIASLVELIVVWGWHAPALRALAKGSGIMTSVEQASFLTAGIFLWVSTLGVGRAFASPSHNAAGAFGLLLTSIHMTLLGALLALSPRPLYGAGEVSCFGIVLDARQDLELGGVIMLMVGPATYLAGGVALLARVLNTDEDTGRALW
ncbi:cytochrome c oxidase assembly protein [Aquamicrobium sp. LC103]|uniref:cytochrome c oxidase assembly protein n=1 Tax=Aquamicrobium sp. LC103 TaxID=1120658 RepID=UPI00063EB3F1|nr:cytochrome c oxidase assembly protein [Aquamicrobium sp. LC103]TKT76154.1 cytochrome c oxidase assembly protein [Aquamicrobium sp. LC103]